MTFVQSKYANELSFRNIEKFAWVKWLILVGWWKNVRSMIMSRISSPRKGVVKMEFTFQIKLATSTITVCTQKREIEEPLLAGENSNIMAIKRSCVCASWWRRRHRFSRVLSPSSSSLLLFAAVIRSKWPSWGRQGIQVDQIWHTLLLMVGRLVVLGRFDVMVVWWLRWWGNDDSYFYGLGIWG